MFLVILLGLAIPLPLAIYFLILHSLNRHTHPVMVPGTWDFALVLFATSGFLLFGGPAVLAGFHERARDYIIFRSLRHLDLYQWRFWIGAWLAYALVVIAAAVFLVARRRWATAVYNVEALSFRQAFAETLDRLRLEWLRDAEQVFITVPETTRCNTSRATWRPTASARRPAWARSCWLPAPRASATHCRTPA